MSGRTVREFEWRGHRSKSLFDLPTASRTVSSQAIAAFSHLGYVPGTATIFNEVTCRTVGDWAAPPGIVPVADHPRGTAPPHASLKAAILAAIDDRVESGKPQVVPISGGLDSRLVLLSLLEFFRPSDVHTYTYGVPGTLDFDIASRLAESVGTRHVEFRASETEYTRESLQRAVVASGGNTEVFYPLVLNRVVDHFGGDARYWSGFAGDLVAGSFVDRLDGGGEDVISYGHRGFSVSADDSEAAARDLMSDGSEYRPWLSSREAAFWANHLNRYTAHHVFRDDMHVEAPLVGPQMLDLFMGVPHELRREKSFYRQAAASCFDGVFDLPLTASGYQESQRRLRHSIHRASVLARSALWRVSPRVPHPRLAYIDMANDLRTRQDLQDCVQGLLEDLYARDVVDNASLRRAWKRHRDGDGDFTKDVICHASLELILESGGA